MDTLDRSTIAYLVGIVVAGVVVLRLSWTWIRRFATEQRRKIEERQRFDPIFTTTPVDDPKTLARERGFMSIEHTSTVTRRLLLPLILITVLSLSALPFLDRVPATMFSLLVAAITVLIGIAARPFVENAIAGLVISSSKILNIGDTIRIDGHYGTVEDITVTHTTVKIWDWRRYVVPNAKMLQREFENYSLFDRHIWAHAEFWVDYDADLARVSEIALASPLESTHFNPTEPPKFWVMRLEKDTIHCWVAAWAKTPADAWALTHDMRTKIATDLRREGIRTHRTVWAAIKDQGALSVGS